MGIRRYKPTSPGRRKSSVQTFDDVTSKPTVKRLIKKGKNHAGRTKGKITVRHRGGGAKSKLRRVDFLRNKHGIDGRVAEIEYDPGRNARIALINYVDGEKRYILACQGMKVGDVVVSDVKKGPMKPGNRYPLHLIPEGMTVYNIELRAGTGGKMVRSAGNSATFMGVEEKHAQLRLPSGEIRLVDRASMASIGSVSNPDYRLIRWGKAGRMRHRGFRPTVRGKAMNPVDHPHGGGEGGSPIGLKHPKTPQGKPALGVKTRRKKTTDKLILQRGKKRKRR